MFEAHNTVKIEDHKVFCLQSTDALTQQQDCVGF